MSFFRDTHFFSTRIFFSARGLLAVLIFCCIMEANIHAQFTHPEKGETTLEYFVKLAQEAKIVPIPVSGIYDKNEILFCEGDTDAAKANNRAADLMLLGDFQSAQEDLEKSLVHAPLFLPFQYNLGVCYYHLNDRVRSRMHLTKAKLIVPEYFLTYLQLGHLEQLEGKDDLAVLNYRDALRKNPKHLDALVLMGDIFFRRRQFETASRYYEAVLTIDPLFSNALLGKAKIMFAKEQFYKAYQALTMISTKGNYDKSLHYYFAECSYRLQDYDTALAQYTKLLEFKSDRFFVTTSIRLIEHKQELARRFVTQFEVK